jgi:hypothetical protein
MLKSVSATSVAQNAPSCAPGQFCPTTPKWTHTEAHLTATANPAICSYSILVPGGQAFSLSASTQFMACGGSGLTYVMLKASPSTGQQTVSTGTSKDANLVVQMFDPVCEN